MKEHEGRQFVKQNKNGIGKRKWREIVTLKLFIFTLSPPRVLVVAVGTRAQEQLYRLGSNRRIRAAAVAVEIKPQMSVIGCLS